MAKILSYVLLTYINLCNQSIPILKQTYWVYYFTGFRVGSVRRRFKQAIERLRQ